MPFKTYNSFMMACMTKEKINIRMMISKVIHKKHM